ncbi:MAG: alpha/beta hydrolase [Phenylobacterium sp.]|uniref:alpha/beta fold hydrolase n=1 Tax=Phenylobacterium sp. TaxID=1871053 RepID=UPI0025FED8DF|nr:alpha/beta hydrolase [Phenylobacterium sp.]MCG9915912.1 alpha/beta hydrolase [Phenylobacterium sp.]
MPDLRPALSACSAPTLVIHGALDQVIPRAFAEETAEAIPGARLVILEDMAHDGPPELERQWTGLILDHLGQGAA